MQVRMSLAGLSVNVGDTVNSVGDFTTLLADINPGYSNVDFPVGYPYNWTRYDLAITGLSASAQGRFAFRYYVENAGDHGNADYIGLDSVAFRSGTVGINEPEQRFRFSVYPNPVREVLFLDCSIDIQKVIIRDLLGKVIVSMETDAGATQLNTAGLRSGIYFVSVLTNSGSITRKFNIDR
jgi:hypothetical protein